MAEGKDNWLTNGKCKECRRRDYCSKPCTANKRSTYAFIHNAISDATGLGPIMRDMSEKIRETDENKREQMKARTRAYEKDSRKQTNRKNVRANTRSV